LSALSSTLDASTALATSRRSTPAYLGKAYLARDRLHDAYGIHWNLLAEVEVEYGLDAPLAHRVSAAAMRTEEELLDAQFDPFA